MNRKTNKHFYPIGMAICIAALAAVLSACVFFGILPTLAAPELSFDDKTQILSWGAVDNAQGYRVGIALQDDADETLLDTETQLTQYDCSELNPGAYRITVQAYGDPDAYKDSAIAACRLTIVRSQSGGEQNPPTDIVPDPDTVARLDSRMCAICIMRRRLAQISSCIAARRRRSRCVRSISSIRLIASTSRRAALR